jgi:hypothetical protein
MAQVVLDLVKVATTDNIVATATSTTLSFSGTSLSIDGVSLNSSDRILVKAQSDKKQNGIYVFSVSGGTITLTRSTDFTVATNQTTTPLAGAIVYVLQGDTFAETGWMVTNNTVITFGTTEIEFKIITVNANIFNNVSDNLVYRIEKGYPLTSLELDNNFKYLGVELDSRVRVLDYTGANIVAKINALGFAAANINANRLQNKLPSTSASADTVVLRDLSSGVTATTFTGNLVGNAATATTATTATTANSLSVGYIVPIAQGGTGSTTGTGAADALGVIHKDGSVQMTGRLRLYAPGTEASLNIPSGIPTSSLTGDVWFSGNALQYRNSTSNQTVATLDSPQFTGSPTVPNLSASPSSSQITNVQYVTDRIEASRVLLQANIDTKANTTTVNSSLALKANLVSPDFAGSPTVSGVLIATTGSPTFTGTVTFNNTPKIGVNDVAVLQSPNFTGTPRISGINIATVNDLTPYATTANVNSSLALKADTSAVAASLALKADTSTVNSQLTVKANASDVASSLALKADLAGGPNFTGSRPRINSVNIATVDDVANATTGFTSVYSGVLSMNAREKYYVFRMSFGGAGQNIGEVVSPDSFLVTTSLNDYYQTGFLNYGYPSHFNVFGKTVMVSTYPYYTDFLFRVSSVGYYHDKFYPNALNFNIFVMPGTSVSSLSFIGAYEPPALPLIYQIPPPPIDYGSGGGGFDGGGFGGGDGW